MRPFTLEVETIEGEEIDIEGTKADLVRGRNVVIGSGCEIERVEYSGTLTVDKTAKVEEQVKI
jgi:hypothetical protein